MNIQGARKILNLSQEAFAKKMEVSVRTIGNWEAGKVKVPDAKIEKIKALLAEYGGRDIILVGDGSPGSGKDSVNNTDLSEALLRAFDEIAAQRRVAEKAQQQVDELLQILKSKLL